MALIVINTPGGLLSCLECLLKNNILNKLCVEIVEEKKVIMSNKDIPLVADLDGSLIKIDLPVESFLFVLMHKPFELFKLLLEKVKYRKAGFLKQKLEALADFSLEQVPWSKTFLSFLKEEKAVGRKLVLCTGSAQAYADRINHIQEGLFDETYGSTIGQNLVGHKKGQFLKKKYGEKGFDYAGNSLIDCQVASYARRFILVNPFFLTKWFFKTKAISKVFTDQILKPSAISHILGFPLWFLNCALLSFLLVPSVHGNTFFRLIFTIVVLNFLASAFSVLFSMMQTFSARKQYYENNNTSNFQTGVVYYNNLFATGDMALAFGFFLFFLFFGLFIGAMFYLGLVAPLTWITSILYIFSVYLLMYRKIYGKIIPDFVIYSYLFCVLFMQGIFLSFF